MEYHNDHAQVPVIKNSAVEGPVPSIWRPILSSIVSAFVGHDYRLADGILGVAPVSEITATQISSYIREYGAKLIELPQRSWDTSVCIWTGDHWDALIDLWTEEEGHSDLVLQVHVFEEVRNEYLVTVYMVYVP